eukprot:68382_1
MALKNMDSLGTLDLKGPQGLDLRKTTSQDVRQHLKKTTAYGLTQSITKWLLVDENSDLLSSKFICIRWSQTKGFIVLKQVKADLILYVDLLGAMNSLIASKNEDVNEWLMSTFTFNTQTKNKKQKKKEDDTDEKQAKKKEHHKVITLKQLYEILKHNWGETNIKVSDHAKVNSVIEFRIVATRKMCTAFYQSLDDLFQLLESEDEEEKHTVAMDEWMKKKPHCLSFAHDIGIDCSLTVNAMDDSLISGHIFSIYGAKDGSLFLTIQYDMINKNQVTFATKYLNEFGLTNDNLSISETMKITDLMGLLQSLLKENKLKIEVSDDYQKHQEVLFIVKDQ